MSSSYYRQQLEAYLQTVEVKAELVFDVGGAQKPVKGRTKSWDVKEYHVLDIPEYDLNVYQHVIQPGDMVFCLEVFEYLIEPVTAMKNIADLLTPGGKAVVSFPLVYPLHNEVEWDSLRYTESGVRRIAKASGLTVAKVNYRKAKSGTLTKYYAEDGMRAAKGHNHAVTGYIMELKK